MAPGGTPVAVFSMCSDIGAIVGPMVAGLLADRYSYAWAFALGAALLLVAATYSLRMPRGLPPAGTEPAAAAETVPVGEQQIGGPESDDPTTKDLR